ncbi:MAG TPA: adenylate/guanylate cyclase domain-containing protein [Acetobacteraceae bacterium]|nr:adenylate/guanylate cyclase domain-containing protein [Acetobacteraceae bacterium]
MKTDIAGSTPRFRALLSSDLQALLSEHHAFVARHAIDLGGQIVKPTGDGYWLEFPSVTAAAKSAINMQEALRLVQPSKGDDRLSMRVVIGLGDVTMLDGDLAGDVFALITRIEAITPADEIYLTSAARSTLAAAEVQTALVDSFVLKGFAEPVPVCRVEQRHRTRVIANAYILHSDLRGFVRLTEGEPVETVEHVLDTLDALIRAVAREYAGTIFNSLGDSHCLTFPGASQLMAAADRLSRGWDEANSEYLSGCSLNIALHRGKICAFRSFLYGDGILAAARVQQASTGLLVGREGGIFITNAVRDDLYGSPWHDRLQPVELKLRDARFSGLEVYRFGSAPPNGQAASGI